jgi:hypothetical protein
MDKSKQFHRFGILFDLALLLGVSLFLGSWGGTPFYHPDTLIEKALRTLVQGGDPKFFNYPALMLYLNAYVYQGWLGILQANGGLPGPIVPLDWYLTTIRSGAVMDVPVFTPGHILTLIFSLLGVGSTYLAAYRLVRSRAAALAAGLILATCLLWATDAHYITVDTPLAALGIVTVALSLCFTSPLRIWQIVLLGILAGLTTAAKYNGALVLLAIAAATFLTYPNRWQWMKHMVGVGLMALVVFFAINPYILINSQKFWQDFQYELDHTRRGHPGFTTDQAGWFHLQTSLFLAFGWLPLLLAAAGVVWLALTRRISWAHKAGFLIYPLVGYGVIASSRLAFQRYMLPFLPFIAILAALALYALVIKISQRVPRLRRSALILAVVLFLAAVLPDLRNVNQSDWLLTQPDTRIYFAKIVQNSGLAQARLPGFAGIYTDLYFNYRFKGTQDAANRASVLVFDSFSHDRWIYDLTTRLTVYRKNYAGGSVIQLSPYTRPKAEVSLSVQSLYSPYLPDLYDRALPGPYIEIYLKDGAQINAILAACRQVNANCALQPAEQGYYFEKVMN